MPKRMFHVIGGVVVMCLAVLSQAAAQDPNLTEEELKQFLLQAKIINFRNISKGVTSPWRLRLSDGKLTHDAPPPQSIDESKTNMAFGGGRTELFFRDSYHFDIAAYELARLLGIGDMIPVCVERKWKDCGALSWWVPSKMDEETRKKDNIQPPELNAWNKQSNKMWVFSELIYDTDRNQTNMLISEDWKLWMVDLFPAPSAFRMTCRSPTSWGCATASCWPDLRQLKEADVLEKTKPHISKSEVKALMARRDKIVAFFDKQIAQKGESAVLY